MPSLDVASSRYHWMLRAVSVARPGRLAQIARTNLTDGGTPYTVWRPHPLFQASANTLRRPPARPACCENPLVMRALWNILPSLKPRAWRAGPYVWLSILAGCVGLILSLSAAVTVWHRANRLAELELTARASNYDQTLQFGINMYMRRVAALRSLFESTNVSRELFEKFSKQVL